MLSSVPFLCETTAGALWNYIEFCKQLNIIPITIATCALQTLFVKLKFCKIKIKNISSYLKGFLFLVNNRILVSSTKCKKKYLLKTQIESLNCLLVEFFLYIIRYCRVISAAIKNSKLNRENFRNCSSEAIVSLQKQKIKQANLNRNRATAQIATAAAHLHIRF